MRSMLKVGDPPRVLLVGRPGAGKTTAAARLVELLRAAGHTVAGFVTREIREQGRRVGFEIETVDGGRGLLAHVDVRGGPRVGRYGVALDDLERLAVPVIQQAPDDAIVVVDELGKMELASEPFRAAVASLLARPVAVVATVHAFHHPFTDALKRDPSVTVVTVTARNRDALPRELAARLAVRV
jgi:nucleoside-triphosphatase